MKLSLFDLHCDTAFELLRTGQQLENNRLAVSLQKAKAFSPYVQVMALWTDAGLSDEDGWIHAARMLEYLRSDAALVSGKAILSASLPASVSGTRLLLSVEDLRILAGKAERIDVLYGMGVRILTPLWAGETCIGGAHDTKVGLTPFGKEALRRALSLSMIPDISHASEASADDIFSFAADAGIPVIASHSDAYAVCPASRNLRDGQIRSILSSKGLIGLNFHTYFLREGGAASITDILRHADHFLSLGASDALALGGDMDGGKMPAELPDLASLPILAEALLRQNYPETLVRAIFFDNALRFWQRNFPERAEQELLDSEK